MAAAATTALFADLSGGLVCPITDVFLLIERSYRYVTRHGCVANFREPRSGYTPGVAYAAGSASSRASGPFSDSNGLGIGAAARSGMDAVHWVRLDSRFGTDRADRAGLPPISLSRLRQTV
jgi:hypothetical protein